MTNLIKLWCGTIISFVLTFVLLGYGYIVNNSTIFFVGDLIGVPFSIICFLAYKEEYNGYVDNERNFK